MVHFVSYLRVSTSQQGAKGLGIEAQRQAVQNFAKAQDAEVVAEYVARLLRPRQDHP